MLFYPIFILVLTMVSFQGFRQNGLKGIISNAINWRAIYHAMAALFIALKIMLDHLNQTTNHIWLSELLQNTLFLYYGFGALLSGLIALPLTYYLNKQKDNVYD